MKMTKCFLKKTQSKIHTRSRVSNNHQQPLHDPHPILSLSLLTLKDLLAFTDANLSYLSFYLPGIPYQSSLKPHFPGNIFLIFSRGNFIHSSRGFKYHLMLMTLKSTSPALFSKLRICVTERSTKDVPPRFPPGNTNLTCLKPKSSSLLPSPTQN